MADQTSLTGRWIGRYVYDTFGDPCSFDAWLSEDAGGLSGETVEPNTFAPDAGDTLMAVITGQRVSAQVSFTKTYTDIDIDKVRYEGEVNDDATRISGHWFIVGAPWFRGAFTLNRPQQVARTTALEMEAT